MATCSCDCGRGYTLELTVTAKDGYNIENNTSVVTWQLVWKCGSSYYQSYTDKFRATIGGVDVYNANKRISFSSKNSAVEIATGETTINHNSDGSKTLEFGCGFTLVNNKTDYRPSQNATATGSMTLVTIPRASTPTVSLSSVLPGNSVTIYTNRFADTFTHTITWSCGASSGTVGTGVTTSTTFTVPMSLIKLYPNTSKTLTFTVATYSGSTHVGDKPVSITVRPYGCSTISQCTGRILGETMSFTIASSHSSFKHSIFYDFGSKTGQTAGANLGTAHSFTPPLSLCSEIPDRMDGTMSVRLRTYYDGVQIGDDMSYSYNIKVPASVVPSFSGLTLTRVDNGVPSTWGKYVKSYSQCTVDISGATGIYGSTITSYSISSDAGHASDKRSFTTPVLNVAKTITFTAMITDSRGQTFTSNLTVDGNKASIVVVDYEKPSINLEAKRCKDDTSMTIDSAGTSLRVTCNYMYTSVGGSNSATVTVKCNNVTQTNPTNGVDFRLDANCAIGNQYTVEATITDSLNNSSTVTVHIPTAERILNIKQNGKGMGIGGFAVDDEVLKVGWTLDMDGNSIINVGNLKSLLLDMMYPVGSIYMNVNSTSPATRFGGTWEQLENRFLLAAGSSYTAGNTGGAATVALVTGNLPSHSHGLNSHTHSVGAHSHGLNSHTHGVGTIAPANAEITGHATFRDVNLASSDLILGTDGTVFSYSTVDWADKHWAMNGQTADGYKKQRLGFNGTHTHTMSGSTATASGSTANSSAFNTSAASGNTAAVGSGNAHENMPPYLVVYMWKRTA